MKIFLLKDVEGVGFTGDIASVSDGYARNKLIPEGRAVEVTKTNKMELTTKTRMAQNRKEALSSQSSMLAEKIHSTKLLLKRKTHDTGHLYGSVSAGEIIELMSQKGFSISKSQVKFDKLIKTIGSYQVTIKLSSKLKPEITLDVVAEQ